MKIPLADKEKAGEKKCGKQSGDSRVMGIRSTGFAYAWDLLDYGARPVKVVVDLALCVSGES